MTDIKKSDDPRLQYVERVLDTFESTESSKGQLEKYFVSKSALCTSSMEKNSDDVDIYLVSDIESIGRIRALFLPAQLAQIRDLLRCIAWIRDLQLISDPNTFDHGELFRDINRKYLADQLLTATKLYAQLDDYCKANQIPDHLWKME